MDLQESLTDFYKHLEEGYYAFCDNLQNNGIPIYDFFVNPIEGKGIPSLPVLILLFLAIIAGGAFLFLFSQPITLQVSVLSEEGAIDGATVTLNYEEVSKSLVTANGLVEFENLPKGKEAQLTVSKEGYQTRERKFVIGTEPSIKVLLLTDAETEIVVQVLDFQGSALQGATVSYSFLAKSGDQISDSAITDASGKILIKAPEGAEVSATASLSGYETKSSTFVVDKSSTLKRIVLQKLEPSVKPPDPEFSQFTVEVKDDADGSALDAEITIFDSFTQEVLLEGKTTYGILKTSDLKVGSTVKVVAKATGYVDEVKVKTLRQESSLVIRMRKKTQSDIGNETDVKINVIDATGRPLTAEIRVFEFSDESNYTLFKKSISSSELKVVLREDRIYYATAYRKGYLPGRTQAFLGAASQTITLFDANSSNSVNLTINAFDEEGNKVHGATVAFFDELGDQVAPFDLKTNYAGKLIIKDYPQGSFRIAASKPPLFGSIDVVITEDMEIDLQLIAPRGVIEVTAIDWDTNESIESFAVEVTATGPNKTQIATCETIDGLCRFELPTGTELEFVLDAPNYETSKQTARAVLDVVKQLRFRLMHANGSSSSRIEFDSLVDLNYEPVDELVSGSYYIAIFDVYTVESAEEGGVFLKLEAPDGSEAGKIVNYSWEGAKPFRVTGSEKIKKTNVCALSFDSQSSKPKPLSWLNAQYSFKGSTKVSYLIRVDTGISASEMIIQYRSYAYSAGEYFRDPYDEELGFEYETLAKEWCTAKTKSVSFSLTACGSLGESCCIDRAANEGGSCNLGYQCVASEGNNLGICSYPTACGTSNYFCSDNAVCCYSGGRKACLDSTFCDPENFRGCKPPCDPETEYCNSADTPSGAGVCEPISALCGKENQICCSEGEKCDAGLGCSASNYCIQCGGLDEPCCAYTPANPGDACQDDMQCVISGASKVCQNPQVCGPSKEQCTGATICCDEPPFKGVCVTYELCANQVSCPTCDFDQYCDASNLASPECKDCSLSPENCNYGDLGELCSTTDPALACREGMCVTQTGSNLGICYPCGSEGDICCTEGEECDSGLLCTSDNICELCGVVDEACCSSDPECMQDDSVCNSEANICELGKRDCSADGCISIEFEQHQCDITGRICTDEKGGNGFKAHSLIGCGENCSEGDLIVSYILENIAGIYPAELIVEISDGSALKPVSIFSGSNRIIQLDSDSNTFTVPIPDSTWLRGKIRLKPHNANPRVVVRATFTAEGMDEVSVGPYVSVISQRAAQWPEHLENLFACEKLELKNTLYEGTIKPIIESSCDKIVFQVDSIFPADAIPLDVSEMGSCGNWDLIFGDEQNETKYNNCFDYGTSPGGRALRYWPSKDQSCLLSPVGNSVPAADIDMKVRCLTTQEEYAIEVVITNYTLTDIKGLDVAVINYKGNELPEPVLPTSFYLYNTEQASPLRLIYALNNRVRSTDVNYFNRRDNYWVGEYRPDGTYFSRSESSSKLLKKQERVQLTTWNTETKSSMIVFSEPDDQKRVAKKPPKVFGVYEEVPATSSLSAQLISRALARTDANNFENSEYAHALIDEFKKAAKEVAEKTVFKRSFDNKMYCLTQSPTVDDTQNPEVCRGSASAWLVVSHTVQNQQEACTFCYDSYSQIYGEPDDAENADVCDIRCQPDDSPECDFVSDTGYCASINSGDTYVNSSGGTETCPAEDSDPNTDDGYGCYYACNAKSNKQGDYCGPSQECSTCSPDGVRHTSSIYEYEYVWENPSDLYEVILPLGVEAQNQQLPYKYFVSSPAANPFTFSAVLPLSADIIYNRLNKAPLFNVINENYIDYNKNTLPNECKVRQGIYLLQTKTSNGIDFFSTSADSGKFISLAPLQIKENYPESQAPGQDYCGNVYACNLFDPYDVETIKPSMATWFNQSYYLDRCFTWEWPIIPNTMKLSNSEDEVWLGLIPYGGTKMDFNRYIKESRSVFSARFITVLAIAVGAAITGGALGYAYLGVLTLTATSAAAIGAGIGLGAGLAIGYGTAELVIDDHPKKWVYRDPNYYSFPVSQQLASNLESSYLLGMLYYSGGKSCLGCNDVPWTVHAYAVPPYDISKYPNVFGDVWLYAKRKTDLDPDDKDRVTIDDFGSHNLVFDICGKDREGDCD